MRKIIFLSTLLAFSYSGFAQNKRQPFFDQLAISFSLGADKFQVDKDKWRDVWKNSSRPIAYNFDSLKFEQTTLKCGLRLPRLDKGLRVQVGKDLFPNNSHRLLNRKLSITAGLGYSQVNYRHDFLVGGDGFYFPDTSKIYLNKSLQFTQAKSVLEINQSVQYKYNSFLFKGVEYYFGIGYVVSMEISNRVKENYDVDKNSYNSNLHYFQKEVVVSSHETLAAHTATRFQLFVPFGFTKRLSDASRLLFELDYTYSNNPYTDVYKKNEAYKFHVGYMYSFNW